MKSYYKRLIEALENIDEDIELDEAKKSGQWTDDELDALVTHLTEKGWGAADLWSKNISEPEIVKAYGIAKSKGYDKLTKSIEKKASKIGLNLSGGSSSATQQSTQASAAQSTPAEATATKKPAKTKSVPKPEYEEVPNTNGLVLHKGKRYYIDAGRKVDLTPLNIDANDLRNNFITTEINGKDYYIVNQQSPVLDNFYAAVGLDLPDLEDENGNIVSRGSVPFRFCLRDDRTDAMNPNFYNFIPPKKFDLNKRIPDDVILQSTSWKNNSTKYYRGGIGFAFIDEDFLTYVQDHNTQTDPESLVGRIQAAYPNIINPYRYSLFYSRGLGKKSGYKVLQVLLDSNYPMCRESGEGQEGRRLACSVYNFLWDVYNEWKGITTPQTQEPAQSPSTEEEKMQDWHTGKLQLDLSTCSDEELMRYYAICDEKGYSRQAALCLRELIDKGFTYDPSGTTPEEMWSK